MIKLIFKYLIWVGMAVTLTSCTTLDLKNILSLDFGKTIPSAFKGRWADKAHPSVSYCYPRGDFLYYTLIEIVPSKNYLELITFGGYQILSFDFYSENMFSAQVKATSIELDPEDIPSVSYQKLTAKIVNNNTINIDGKNYYRCPKSPY